MKLLILKGPPGTGKSTWRKEMCLIYPNMRYVNLDEFRLVNPTIKERQIQDLQREKVEQYRSEQRDIIIDNTNLNPNTLQHWVNWANSNGYDYEIKEFGRDVPLVEAIRRDALRGNSVGKSVIIQMYIEAGLFTLYPKCAAIIIDLDGTLCDISHRRHYVTGEGKKDWKSFFSELSNDVPNDAVKFLYERIVNDENDAIEIIFLSGRPSEYRKQTEQWLDNHGFSEYFALFMRPYNNKEDDVIVKEQLYRKYVEPYFDVKFALDDRNRVVDMWRKIGLKCFQVEPGDF